MGQYFLVALQFKLTHLSALPVNYLLSGLMMFLVTIFVTGVILIPSTKYPRSNKLINFYWLGFWVYLAMIASISGAANTLMLLEYEAMPFANAVLTGLTASFIVFVIFAWVRFSGALLITGVRHIFIR